MARIGLLSDSHGQLEKTRQAVEILIGHGVQRIIHLGDICDEKVLDELVAGQVGSVSVHVVFGNMDIDPDGLGDHAKEMGIHVDHPMGRIDLDGKVFAFTHGHIDKLLEAALAESVDYLFHGHTHVARDSRVGATRVINPGALFRASRYTVALLESEIDELSFYTVS